ncbi:hypothetical protein QJ857_gp0570 [Tupanvirus soda lake]|uniref:Uncharacterized protein n=2 Tax=Tupanvirus TaxID=2094720 RepID=A0A6N1NW12_9VIRU|nr:hypothetical protein QJ857_gp0570 [Tupanvirus soda lake]QKU35473.1 hypothetical protein [Tupanvirus soda lake]
MFTLQDGIKYIGLAAIVYFLLKAFANNILTNCQIIILVLCIMLFVIFIASQNFNCPNKYKVERFDMTNGITNSVYDGPLNHNIDDDDTADEYNNMDHSDDDINDFKDIMGIDKQRYEQIKNTEKNAMDRIRSNHKNEMIHTTTHPFNTVPLGTQLYGYTYLPPENWFRAYERPPVCISEKICAVCPVADPSTAGLLEFDSNNNIMGPMGINHRYSKKVLNKDK